MNTRSVNGSSQDLHWKAQPSSKNNTKLSNANSNNEHCQKLKEILLYNIFLACLNSQSKTQDQLLKGPGYNFTLFGSKSVRCKGKNGLAEY